MAKVQNGEKYCRKFQPLSRAHERYRRHADNSWICDSKDPNVTYSHVRVKILRALRSLSFSSSSEIGGSVGANH